MFSITELQLLYNTVSSSIKDEFELAKLGTLNQLEELLSLRAKIQHTLKNFVLDSMEEELKVIWEKSKLEAIKHVRNLTGLSLIECKRLLDDKFGK